MELRVHQPLERSQNARSRSGSHLQPLAVSDTARDYVMPSKDVANQVRFSQPYADAVKAAGKPPANHLTAETGEWMSGQFYN